MGIIKKEINSPFTPGSPVPTELFEGREKQIKEIIRYIDCSISGKQENVFLTGERGIGKSSLASFIRYYISKRKDIIGIHTFLGQINTLEEMVHLIFDQLLKVSESKEWFEKISDFFGKHIRKVGLFGVSASFSPPDKDLRELVRNFPEALYNLISRIKDVKNGLFIALDDINGLAEKQEFANWYKSTVDEIATHYQKFPVFIMLIGLPDKRDRLSDLQPSLTRIFRLVEIDKLTNEEVKNFLIKAFDTVNVKVLPEALALMVKYSSGLPIIMHEVGDSVFWANEDDEIDRNDVLRGLIDAARRIGTKYLDPKVYRKIRSENYKSILRKMGQSTITRNFTRDEILKILTSEEKQVFDHFLNKLKELGVIESNLEKGRGSYKFVNDIYPVYIWMESQSKKLQ